mmetsp:Transcript_249/g.810  ORF Transcript_249/g.810 Transcript_249/m.810 type:complete len:231 (+) Transcript_249:1865-2557(+)
MHEQIIVPVVRDKFEYNACSPSLKYCVLRQYVRHHVRLAASAAQACPIAADIAVTTRVGVLVSYAAAPLELPILSIDVAANGFVAIGTSATKFRRFQAIRQIGAEDPTIGGGPTFFWIRLIARNLKRSNDLIVWQDANVVLLHMHSLCCWHRQAPDRSRNREWHKSNRKAFRCWRCRKKGFCQFVRICQQLLIKPMPQEPIISWLGIQITCAAYLISGTVPSAHVEAIQN